MASQTPVPPQAPAPKNHSNLLWVIAAILVGIIVIVGVFFLGAKVGNQAGVQQVAAAQESAKPADPPAQVALAANEAPAQADKAAPAAPAAPAQPASQPAPPVAAAPAQPDKAALAAPAAPAQAASGDCSVKPATREGFVACHEARLLQLERDYIKRDPTSKVPTDKSVIAWMEAAGLTGQFYQQDARQVHEKQILVNGELVTVVEAVQLTCRVCTVKWPAVWTTDRPVDTNGGARFIKPTRDNPSVVYTNVSVPFSGTLTFYGDGEDFGTLWP